MESVAVIGLGSFGSKVAVGLFEQGEDVLAIDINEELVNEYANSVSRAVIADAKRENVLKQIGVDRCDCAVVATTSDLATAVLITMNLKSLGVKEIICKAKDETDKVVLEKLGATKIIIPERIAADRLCKTINHPNVLDYIEVSEKYGIIEIDTPKAWIGKSVVELNVRAKYGVNIIALKKEGDVTVAISPQYRLTDSDVLVILGESTTLNKVQEIH